jgi:ketosteroid isomerase-like protein
MASRLSTGALPLRSPSIVVGVTPSNLDLVRVLYERFSQGGVGSALELLSEDFVAEVPPSMSAEPDVYEGREGALRYMRAFDGLMEDVRFEPVELHEHGDLVIAELRWMGRGAASGVEIDQRVVVLHEIDDGKIKRMDPYPDLDTALSALAAREGGPAL